LITPPLFRPQLAWLPAPEAPTQAQVAAPALPTLEPADYLPPPPAPLRITEVRDARKPTATFTRVLPPEPAAPRPVPVPPQPAPAPAASTPASEPPSAVAPLPPVPATSTAEKVGEFLAFLAALWLIGAGVVLVRAGLHAWRFARLLSHARPAPLELQQ